jgi:hypothetical protein
MEIKIQKLINSHQIKNHTFRKKILQYVSTSKNFPPRTFSAMPAEP